MISKKGLGIVSVVDKDGVLLGVITDGDLRRLLQKRVDVYSVYVDDVMTQNPKTTTANVMAIEALRFIKDNDINNLPVIDMEGKLCGTITWQMIVKTGIVL